MIVYQPLRTNCTKTFYTMKGNSTRRFNKGLSTLSCIIQKFLRISSNISGTSTSKCTDRTKAIFPDTFQEFTNIDWLATIGCSKIDQIRWRPTKQKYMIMRASSFLSVLATSKESSNMTKMFSMESNTQPL